MAAFSASTRPVKKPKHREAIIVDTQADQLRLQTELMSAVLSDPTNIMLQELYKDAKASMAQAVNQFILLFTVNSIVTSCSSCSLITENLIRIWSPTREN
jgi:hypothetical protein